MATVTSQLTRIHDAEGALTTVAIGGGAGATANTDIFIQGAQSLARRQSNVTLGGFLLDDGAGNDLSAADVHVGVWVWVTHYAVLTALRVRIGSNSAATNYDEHSVPLTEYPSEGGWVRVWLDISRTPDATGGTALDEATARYFGPVVSIPSVGGNAPNIVLDAIDHTTTGLLLTGTAGLWSDFTAADEGNTTNKYGVIASRSGVYFCRARLTLGSATSLVFSDSGFSMVFPQQALVADTFMGVTVDLQNASTDVTWSRGVFSAPGTKKGDIIVTGTSGTLLIDGCAFNSLRILTFTSGVTVENSSINTSGLVTQAGAVITTCSFNAPTGTVGLLSNNPADVSYCTFVSDGTGHAIEITTAGTYNFAGNSFSGYAGTNGSTGNEAIYNNSGGAVTLNITAGGTTPTIRNGTGASTTVNSNIQVTLTGLKNPSEVRVFTANTTTEIAGQETVTSGSFSFSVGAGVAVDIAVLALGYQNIRLLSYSATADTSLPVQQVIDRQYLNP